MTIIRTNAQKAVMRVFQETLVRIRADALVRATCWREGAQLFIAGQSVDLSRFKRVLVLGAGKASAAMGEALVDLLQGSNVEGFLVTKYEHGFPVTGLEVMEAGHPLPDENSIRAGVRIMEFAGKATEDDLVLVLISGGASALMEVPLDGVSLRDLQLVTTSLMKSGADIRELNVVRSGLSKIKAGGLARACGSATMMCLVLSDVIGNDRAIVGSGPCWGAPPEAHEVLAVLRSRRVPVQECIMDALANSPRATPASPQHVIIGDIFTSLEIAHRCAVEAGLRPRALARTFTGEAREVGAFMAAETLSLFDEKSEYDCVIAAGESTVTVRGEGLGGRNQEIACAAALALAGVPNFAFLAAGTDGTDGPTNAAGGLVDGETHLRADFRKALDDNDSYRALDAAGALIMTGATQTNLCDLVIAARIEE